MSSTPDAFTSPDSPLLPDASPPDAFVATRSYALASTGAQIELDTGLGLYPANLATDVDVVAIHQDFYGLPWDELRSGQPLPALWVATMDRLVADAHATGRPIFLTLSLVQGTARQYLADKAVVQNGKLTKLESWSAHCYDFARAADGPALRAAYVAYVEWMVDRFDPTWINVAAEMNLFDAGCPAAWDGLVDTERAAYQAAKARKPSVIAFPSFQLDFLYGEEASQCPAPRQPADCYDENYARLDRALRDRFAVSTYPYLIDAFADVTHLPDDWFVRGAARGGEQLLVAETGWLATNANGLLGDQCVNAIAESPTAQLAYFDRVIAGAQAGNADVVTWWSNRDVVPENFMVECPCTFDTTWCSLIAAIRQQAGSDANAQFFAEMGLKIFGSMGLRDHEGNPRPDFFARWSSLRAVPLARGVIPGIREDPE